MEFTTAALMLAIVLIVIFLRARRQKRTHPQPPEPPAHFLFAHMKYLKDERVQQFDALASKYGDIFQVRTPHGVRIVVLNSYDTIKEAFVTNGDWTSGRAKHNFNGAMTNDHKGVLFSDGHLWKVHRRFALSNLRDFGLGRSVVERTIHTELEHLRTAFAEAGGRSFNPSRYFPRATGNVICSLVMSERISDNPYIDDILYKLNRVVAVGPSHIALVGLWPILKYLPGDISRLKTMLAHRNAVTDYAKTKVKQHKETLDRDNIRDFIDAFLAEMENDSRDETFDYDQLCQLIFDLFAAGTETTSTTLLWSMIFLARYPDVQRKIFAEIENHIGDSKLPLTSDKNKMPYVEAAVYECLRFACILPHGIPHRVNTPGTIRGYRLEKDDMIIPNLWYANRHDAVWKDPLNFNPENFLDENGKLANTNNLLTFSIGKRECLGETLAKQEVFIFLVGLMQQYEFIIDPENEPPANDFFDGSSLGRSPHDFKIIAKPRTTASS